SGPATPRSCIRPPHGQLVECPAPAGYDSGRHTSTGPPRSSPMRLLPASGCAMFLLAAVVSPAGAAGPDGPTRPLTVRGRDNLVAFARLFGYVRYFHPSDEVLAADWSAVAVDGAARVEGVETPAELARRLTEVFAPFAPTLAVYPTADGPPPAVATPKAERLL